MSDAPLALSLGHVGIEIACRVPRLEADTPLEMDELSLQVGGGAAIAAATATRLGCRARLACKLGRDLLGQHVLSALIGFGIDTRCAVFEASQLSPLAVGVVAARGRRAGYFSRGDVEALTADEVDPAALLDEVGVLLVDGTCPSAQVAVAQVAAASGIPVVFDGGHIHEGIGTLVGMADVLICSERLATELAPRDDLEASLVEIQRLGPRAVIITLGNAGSIGLCNDELVHQPSFPVQLSDSWGAGAIFHGAFATAMLAQLPFSSCMEFASAAAALSCRVLGGFAGIPARDEVVALVKARSSEVAR